MKRLMCWKVFSPCECMSLSSLDSEHSYKAIYIIVGGRMEQTEVMYVEK